MWEVVCQLCGPFWEPSWKAKSIEKNNKRHQKQNDFKTNVPGRIKRSEPSSLGPDGPRGGRVCRVEPSRSQKTLGFEIRGSR